MAKKVSKHSRAARRATGDEPESKVLAQLPRPEKTDLTNILTRTAAKNEALLEAKMQRKTKNKIGKKSLKNKLDTSVIASGKDRFERALNVASKLDGKIAKSVSRAKYVQNARKAGWDSINEQIKKESSLLSPQDDSIKKTATTDEIMEEEIEERLEDDHEQLQQNGENTPKNLFSLLTDDVEV